MPEGNAAGSRIKDDGPLVSAARNVEGVAHNVANRASEFASRASEKSKEMVDGSREYIRENPLKTVLVAAGVGCLIGYMIGRRR